MKSKPTKFRHLEIEIESTGDRQDAPQLNLYEE